MPAGITEHDTVISADRKPMWHRLGTPVEGAPTLREAFYLANLDWTVSKQPITVVGADGITEGMEDLRAVVRDDTGHALGVVRKSYQEIQNIDTFDFLDNLIDDGELTVETAGSVNGGKWVWVLARMPQAVKVADDPYKSYMACVTSHDGTLSLTAMATNVRIVCQNTVQFALGSTRQKFRVRHTMNAPRRIDEARRVLGLTYEHMDALGETMTMLQDITVTDSQFEAITAGMFPEKDDPSWDTAGKLERSKMVSAWHSDTVGRFHGTAYGAYQAVNEWELWLKARLPKADQQVYNVVQNRATKRADKLAKIMLSSGLPSRADRVEKVVAEAGI